MLPFRSMVLFQASRYERLPGQCRLRPHSQAGEPYGCKLQADDVDVDLRRFSIDFDPDEANPRPTPLITGDQVEFKAKVATDNLELVDGVTDNGVTRWVHVDQTGGILALYQLPSCGQRQQGDRC